jgi:hypothetical protein
VELVLRSAWTRKAHPTWTRDDVLRLTRQQLARALDSIRKYKPPAAAAPLPAAPRPFPAGLAATGQCGGGGGGWVGEEPRAGGQELAEA